MQKRNFRSIPWRMIGNILDFFKPNQTKRSFPEHFVDVSFILFSSTTIILYSSKKNYVTTSNIDQSKN